jgi:hypothetical protein
VGQAGGEGGQGVGETWSEWRPAESVENDPRRTCGSLPRRAVIPTG